MKLDRRHFLGGWATLLEKPTEGRWQETDAFLDAARTEGTIPGAALIASRGGSVRHERYVGAYCGLQARDLPLTRDVLHPLFSYSKLLAATAISIVCGEAGVDLDLPIAARFPEFGAGGKETATLRHAMTHALGIPEVPLGPVDTEAGWQTAWKAVCAAPAAWAPGSRTAYHGLTGFFVAAQVARTVAGGASWETLCRERLFAPIGAASLTFGLPAGKVARTPQPAALPGSLPAALPFAGHPAAGCFGTVADALKVLHLHLRGGFQGRRRLIPVAWFEEMHRIQYRDEIVRARAAGKEPAHETWGLGPLLRGPWPKNGSHDWFGMGDQAAPGIFGHAGIDTVIGVADPQTGRALVFISTNSPQPAGKTVPLRNGIADRVLNALR